MKRKELIKFYNFLCKDVIAVGCKYPKMAEHKVDEYLSTLPDEKEEDEINPYLLTGEELERAVEKRKSNQP